MSESEAYRHLSDRILPWMTEKNYKKEKDKTRLSKKLIVHPGFPDASEDECKEGVNAWIGVTPLEVKALRDGEFECTMGSDEKNGSTPCNQHESDQRDPPSDQSEAS